MYLKPIALIAITIALSSFGPVFGTMTSHSFLKVKAYFIKVGSHDGDAYLCQIEIWFSISIPWRTNRAVGRQCVAGGTSQSTVIVLTGVAGRGGSPAAEVLTPQTRTVYSKPRSP